MADNYTRGNYADLPGTVADLETAYSSQDYIDVSSINSVFVAQSAVNEYPIHEFKKDVGAATSGSWTVTGKSNSSCVTNPTKLQIWNITGGVWEDLATDNTTVAGSTITLTGSKTDLVGPPSYKDGSNLVSFRVYQSSSGFGPELWEAAAAAFTTGTYSWGVYGTNTIANDGTTGNPAPSLRVTYVDNDGGAFCDLKEASDLTANMGLGKTYRLTCDAKINSGSAINITVYDGVGYNPASISGTDFAQKTIDFTCNDVLGCAVRFSDMTTGQIVWVDNMSLKEKF